MRRSELEGHRCELNNATYEGNENDLEENANYLYRGTKVTLIVQIIMESDVKGVVLFALQGILPRLRRIQSLFSRKM